MSFMHYFPREIAPNAPPAGGLSRAHLRAQFGWTVEQLAAAMACGLAQTRQGAYAIRGGGALPYFAADQVAAWERRVVAIAPGFPEVPAPVAPPALPTDTADGYLTVEDVMARLGWTDAQFAIARTFPDFPLRVRGERAQGERGVTVHLMLRAHEITQWLAQMRSFAPTTGVPAPRVKDRRHA